MASRRHAMWKWLLGHVDAPSIAGSWIIPLDSPSSKGRRHSGSLSSSTVRKSQRRFFAWMEIPVLTAVLTKMENGCLSHFDGSRPGVIEVSWRRMERSRFSEWLAVPKKP
jgi:hypothetical protein